MGFEPNRVDWALKSTGGGLQGALDHLEAHQDEPMPENWNQPDSMAAPSDEAKCQKLFRDMDLAMYHADKSGHEDFAESSEEIKPLTEEEKQQRLAELRNRLSEKRAAKESELAAERKANEQIRRKAGQDASQVREELERKGASVLQPDTERIKEAERKRRERLDDIAARDRVRQQIEEDKRARAEKAAREKALREGRAPPTNDAGPARPLASQLPRTSSASETRLRVRAPGGTWMGVLQATSTLVDVERAILVDGKGNGASCLVVRCNTSDLTQFSTTFPRKTYDEAERTKTLKELGLVPNAALEASLP